MTKKLGVNFLCAFLVLFSVLALPLSADNKSDRKAIFVDRFAKEGKQYLLVDEGMCFELVDDKWKCDNWLPGDPIQIKRLSGFYSFEFSITNLSTERTVYANFAYVTAQEDTSNESLRKKINDLEKRVAYLERIVK